MSNIARQSSGLRTVNSIGRVLRSPSIAIAAARETLKLSHRFHSGFHALTASISMKVANASLSQMPFHQRIVTRSPNHMCAFSCETTSATRSSSARDAVFFSASRAVSRNAIAPRVFHRPRREIRNRNQVELVAGILEPVVVGKIFERERAYLLRPTGQRLLAGNMNDAQRRARIDRRGRHELADDKRDQVSGHRDRLLEDDLLLAARQLALALLPQIGRAS